MIARGITPKIVREKVELRADLEWYVDAWQSLHRARPAGDGPQPIHLSECVAWLEIGGVSEPSEREEFLSLVQAIDAEWMDWARSRADPPASN